MPLRWPLGLLRGNHDDHSSPGLKALGNPGHAIKILDGCLYLSVDGGVKTDLRNKLGYRLGLTRSLKTIIISEHAKLKLEGYFDNTQDLAIYVCGKGSVEIDKLFAPNVKLTIAGHGKVAINYLNCKNLEATIAGKGSTSANKNSITVEQGSIKSQHLRISGEGDINTSRIISENGDIGVTGKGTAKVRISNYLLAMSDSGENIINAIKCRFTEIKPNVRGFCPSCTQLIKHEGVDKVEDAIAAELFTMPSLASLTDLP